MQLAGRAVDFMLHLDTERERVVQHANEQVERVNVVIADLNKTKEDVKEVFGQIEVKIVDNDQKLLTVPELTRKLDEKTEQIDTLFKETQKFALKSEASLSENETKLNDLHEKTRVSADKITVDLESVKVGLLAETTKLRDDIVT